MASNIGNSNYYSVSSYTNKGISGLISGMDTENMVKQMLSGTQKKIDKQNTLQQQTLWRQEFYREIITSINSVRNKYFNSAFDASPINNLASSKFFNSMVSSVTSGSAVKVISAAAGATAGDMRISVEQLAEAASLSSAKAIGASNSITATTALSESMLAGFEKNLVLNVGGTAVNIDLNGAADQAAMLNRINDALQNAGTGATAKIFDNKLRIIGDQASNTISVHETSTALALKMTGLIAGSSSSKLETDGSQMLQSGSNISPDAGISITVSLDGVEKQITLNPLADEDGKITKEALRDSLQAELNRTFGNYVTASLVGDDNDKIELKLNFDNEAGHSLSIYGMESSRLGIAAGSSSRLTSSSKLSELGVSGERFAFTINGKEFTFSKDDTIGSMINKINSGNAGVQMSFSSVSNMFKLAATSTGSQFGIDIRQTEGNLLGELFQSADGVSMFNSGNSVASGQLTVGSIQGKALDSSYTAAGGASFKINVNGIDHSFTLAERNKEYSADEVMDLMNNWLKDKFGRSGGKQNIEFKDGKLEIRDGSVVKFAQSSVDTENANILKQEEKNDIALALGLTTTAKSNVASANTKVSEIYQLKDIYSQFNGGAINPNTTLAQLTSYEGGKVSFADGRLSLTAENPGDTVTLVSQGMKDLFGVDSLAYNDGKIKSAYEDEIKEGKDAKITINGVQTTRSSNTFTVDGITLQATAKSAGEDTVISTSRDTDSVVTAFKSFIEDYNAMIEKLTGYTTADATYKDYAPLTEEQKKEMSEREIELWEEKAKSGLLRNDSTVTSFLNSLFTSLYSRPAASAFALYDIGIEATDYKQPGKLFFDETKLREALASDPASVEALFTDGLNGMAKQMSTLMDNAAKVSAASPGSLVALAGMKGSSTETRNLLNDNLTSINNKLKDLQDKYEREKARYWKQFNDMEKILANYQSQSSFISQQFGGY